jgi:acyl-CoA synthetase (AMP-forming)/AMP-acid ligase II
VTVGRRWFWGGATLNTLEDLGRREDGTETDPPLADTGPDELAAILFTSGSTGVPKGVVYRHRHFARQVEMLRDAFLIAPGEVDLATFPPFALFDPALGMTTVVPWMDPTRPAEADPQLLTQSMERFGVTNLFGSPALLDVLSRHAEREGIRFPTLRRAISAGAAVPATTVRRMRAAMAEGSRVHTPYGATECLPVASISSEELDDALTRATEEGRGICVGQPVPPNEVAVIPVADGPLGRFDPATALAPGEIGEIVVHGPTTTEAYWRRERQTRLAKMRDDDGRTWHRMGDVGYRDQDGRLWYCGRKSQRVRLGERDLFPDQLEAVFNRHPAVFRTALVGVGENGAQRPVLCVELLPEAGADPAAVQRELLATAASREEWSAIGTVLFHPKFPVDIRHNSKIGREALARWAADQLAGEA